ncbi:MAG: hypothetical protein M9895_00040 [Aquamicrobium sp.]|uniref:hypothetical protein n=1 Tax=Aquamicrobium sp. TaxID=1872579 RepID=UPI00349E761A|nr:hypothetical protein [Aquamicrobium sp.]
MPSSFAELENLISEAVDSVMGEPTRIDRRRKSGRFSSSADDDRDSVTVTGVVDFNPVIADPKDKGQYDGFQPNLSGDKLHVSYAESSFASSDEHPTQDDTIVLIGRPGQPSFRISRVDHDGLGRMVCVCV